MFLKSSPLAKNSTLNIKPQKTQNDKKVIKHSKKFERTQTGCLQCRHKKKKCDGKRPSCVSCTKRGMVCQFPTNIRFFNFDKIQSYSAHYHAPETGTSSNSSNSQTLFEDPKDQHFEFLFQASSTIPEDMKTYSPKSEYDIRTISSSQESFETSKSSFIFSILSDSAFRTHLSSDRMNLSSDRVKQQLLDHSIDPIFKEYEVSSRCINDIDSGMEDALNLANDGKSINMFLNNIAIDLITKSIQNLSYINLEEKLNNHYNNQISQTSKLFLDEFLLHENDTLSDNLFLKRSISVDEGFSIDDFDPIFEF